MSDGNLKLTASADFNQLNNAFIRQQKQVQNLEEQVKKLGGAQTGQTDKADRGLQGIIRRATQVALAYGGIHQAVALVNQALQDEVRLRERSRDLNLTFAQSLQALRAQTLQLTDAEFEQLKMRAVATGQAAGLTPTESIQAAIPSFSATMDPEAQVRIDKAIGAMSEVGRVIGVNLRDMPSLPGAIQDLQRAVGPSMTLEQASQFAFQALSVSRIEDVQDLPNLIRTVAASVAVLKLPDEKKLEAAQEVAALLSALQALTSDTPAAMTSTAITNFISEMKIASRTEGGLMPNQLRQMLMSNERLLDAMKFKGKSGNRLLQPEFLVERSNLADEAAKALQALQDPTVEAYNRLVAAQRGVNDANVSAANALNRGRAQVEESLLGDVGPTMASTVSERLAVTDRGVLAFPRRRLTQLALEMGPEQDRQAVNVARLQLLETMTRPAGGVGRFLDLAGGRRIRMLANLIVRDFSHLSDEDLLSFQGSEDVTKAQTTLRDLLQVIEARENQASIRAEAEAAMRARDNAKLTDTVGRAVNGAVQTQRTGSEQEN